MTDAQLALVFWIVMGLATFVVLVTLGLLLHDCYREHQQRPYRTVINDRLTKLPK